MKVITVLVVAGLISISLTAFSPSPVNKTEVSGVFAAKATFQTDFAFFRAHRQGKGGIALTWGVTDETNLSGFMVERSYNYTDPADEYSYELVHSVSCSGERSYKCIDNDAFPGYILYRVKALMSDGTIITSDVEQVRIVQRH